MSLTREEFFDLPKINKFEPDFKSREFDKDMALGLLNEVQEKWCGCCVNYKEGKCGCYFPDFKKEMIKKINEHFDNQPLKFEELHEGMRVWDDEYKEYGWISVIMSKSLFILYVNQCVGNLAFEENRFYRKQVKE